MRHLLTLLFIFHWATLTATAADDREVLVQKLKAAIEKRDMEAIDALYSWQDSHDIFRAQEWLKWRTYLKEENLKDWRYEWTPLAELGADERKNLTEGFLGRNYRYLPSPTVKGVVQISGISTNLGPFSLPVPLSQDAKGKWHLSSTTLVKRNKAPAAKPVTIQRKPSNAEAPDKVFLDQLKKAIRTGNIEAIDALTCWEGTHDILRDQEREFLRFQEDEVRQGKFTELELVWTSLNDPDFHYSSDDQEEWIKNGTSVRGGVFKLNRPMLGRLEVKWSREDLSLITYLQLGKDKTGAWSILTNSFTPAAEK